MDIHEIDIDNLKPISEADRWGYYNGAMPLYLAYCKFVGHDTIIQPMVIYYDKQFKQWRSGVTLIKEENILGYIVVPKLNLKET